MELISGKHKKRQHKADSQERRSQLLKAAPSKAGAHQAKCKAKPEEAREEGNRRGNE
jgi:hypothetical protein